MLDARLLREARLEEVEFMGSLGVYEASTREECTRRTGRVPITTKWIDAEKGSGGNVQVRSRLVARDFKTKGDSDRRLVRGDATAGGQTDALHDGRP